MHKRKPKVQQQFDILKKIIIIGDSGVGKSNILLRYSQGKFVDNYMMTIGINFMYKVTLIEQIKIKMQIWDTAGQDKYKTITQNYYKNCNGAFVVYSIDSKQSFYSIRNWIEDLTQSAPESTKIMLVGNKMDLINKRQVSKQQAEQFAKQYGIPYMQCSAKSGQSIQEAFYQLGRMMVKGKIGSEDGVLQSEKKIKIIEDGNNNKGNIKINGNAEAVGPNGHVKKTFQEKCCST